MISFFHPVVHVQKGWGIERIDQRGQPIIEATPRFEIPLFDGIKKRDLGIGRDTAHSGDRTVRTQKKACIKRHGKTGQNGNRPTRFSNGTEIFFLTYNAQSQVWDEVEQYNADFKKRHTRIVNHIERIDGKLKPFTMNAIHPIVGHCEE